MMFTRRIIRAVTTTTTTIILTCITRMVTELVTAIVIVIVVGIGIGIDIGLRIGIGIRLRMMTIVIVIVMIRITLNVFSNSPSSPYFPHLQKSWICVTSGLPNPPRCPSTWPDADTTACDRIDGPPTSWRAGRLRGPSAPPLNLPR